MAKLEAVDTEKNPQAKEIFSKITASRGWVSNLMRTLAHAPDGLKQYSVLGHYCRYDTDLTEVQRELAVIGTVRGVPYGWTHHSALAREVGVNDEQLAEIKAGRVPKDFPEDNQALCAFIFAFSAYKGVPQDVLDRMRKHFSPRQITDAALISAYYLAAGSIITAFDVQIEDASALQIEIDWQKSRLKT